MLKDLVKVANRLDSLGLHKEADFLDSLLRKEAATEFLPEPPLNKEDVAKAFEDYFKWSSQLENLKVTSLEWVGTGELGFPHYVVTSEGESYSESRGRIVPYNIDTTIEVLPEGKKSGMPVLGLDENIYYLYAED